MIHALLFHHPIEYVPRAEHHLANLASTVCVHSHISAAKKPFDHLDRASLRSSISAWDKVKEAAFRPIPVPVFPIA